MHGTIAQAVSLVSWGNYFLAGKDIGDYFPNADVFTFCKTVSFNEIVMPSNDQGFERREFAPSPKSWFEKISQNKTRFIQLGWTSSQNAEFPDHRKAAFTSGGGHWQLMTISENDVQTWRSEWVFDEKEKSDLSWTVDWSFYKNPNTQVSKSDLEPYLHNDDQTIIAELERRTKAIQAFGHDHDQHELTQPFATCLDTINNKTTKKDFGFKSLLAPDICDEASLVLANAAQACWVFGGMGSWNDLGFEDKKVQAEYDRLSASLYEILVYSYQALANKNRNF